MRALRARARDPVCACDRRERHRWWRSNARSNDDGRAARARALAKRLTARRDDAGETRVEIGGASTGDAGRDGGERDE